MSAPGPYTDEAQKADMERALTNQPPSPAQVERIELLRQVAKVYSNAIIENCPKSADRTTALRELRLTTMWAVASIVLEDGDT